MLFWNWGRQNLTALTSILAYERDIDLIIIAECDKDSNDLAEQLNKSVGPREKRFQPDSGFSQRLSIVTTLTNGSLTPIDDGHHYSIREYRQAGVKPILIAGVHLPSKRYQSEHSQTQIAVSFSDAIKLAEQKQGHSRTVVIGDFNMNPFEPGMVGARGLHAIMDRKIAKKVSRSIYGEDHKYFYNPMWSMFDDRKNRPRGTYYYSNSTHVNYFWHIFDHILLRPELLTHYKDDGVKIITRIGGATLRQKSGRPNKRISDHFPILLNLMIESEPSYVDR